VNIKSAIQNHFYQESTVIIPASIDSIHNNFAILSTTGITWGSQWECYKFNIQWDGTNAYLDGPHASRTIRLATRIVIQPQSERNVTPLFLTMNIPLQDIHNTLIFLALALIWNCFLAFFTPLYSSIHMPRSIFILFWCCFGALQYGGMGLSVYRSSRIIRECLQKELTVHTPSPLNKYR
jgi:hypothetical protein